MKACSLNDQTCTPCLAFGTGTSLTAKDATDLCSLAIKRGFRHLDTAQMYGNEDSVGRSIAASGLSRSELYITTKLGNLPDRDGSLTVEDSLRRSLRRLQVDYVDMFLIHVPTYFEERLEDIWRQFTKVKEIGLTKSIGVSNFNVKYLSRILDTGLEAPAVNQVSLNLLLSIDISQFPSHKIEYHPFVHNNLIPLLNLHAKHGIVTAFYGGLSPIIPERAGRSHKAPARAKLSGVLDRMAAARTGEGIVASRIQMLLNWLQYQDVIVVT